MAKTLQVRNVPEDIHRSLKERAARAGLSLSDYLLGELSKVAARPPVADVLAWADSRHGGSDVDAIVRSIRMELDRE